MTMKKKLDDAYRRGVAHERGRVLWLMDDERNALRTALEKTILVEAQRHVMQTKIKLAVVIFQQLQHRIVSGHGAPGGKLVEPETED